MDYQENNDCCSDCCQCKKIFMLLVLIILAFIAGIMVGHCNSVPYAYMVGPDTYSFAKGSSMKNVSNFHRGQMQNHSQPMMQNGAQALPNAQMGGFVLEVNQGN